MTDLETPVDVGLTRPLQQHRRIKRGIVASYIHEISERHHAIDIRRSSRHVRVEVDGVTLAESTSARILLETNLPPRYYLPRTDVRLDLLEPTDKVTHCPYKGDAEYWSVRAGDAVHENLAWSYPTPVPESEPIGSLICFYDEHVDLYVDGVLQERPKTKFS